MKPFCDLCGCATSSGSSGFGTLSNSNFIGLRYTHQSFESRDGIFTNSPSSHEYLNTYQLWAQIPLTQKFYATASLPFQDLNRTFDNGSSDEALNGIGDASVVGWFKLQFFKKETNDSIPYPVTKPLSNHSIQIGIGAKLPTGEFEERLTDRVNPGFQVGTGSLDGIFSLGYNYGGEKIGFSSIFTYYLKGENKNDYRYGNQFNYSGNAYYRIPFMKSALMPFIGLSGDIYEEIEQYDETQADTDGRILNGTFGAEYAVGKFIIGANAAIPISQDLFGGNVNANERLSVYVNFAL
ncbi:hypothetical protein [Aurantibacter sp.]|uniref:hypothetical protein n=1 Tax=Aurantibacter sp. TaxID=2807103 RepID=UPI003264AD11